MIKLIDDIKLGVECRESKLYDIVKKRVGGRAPAYFRIVRKSLDARDKSAPVWRYSVAYSAEKYEQPKKVFEKTGVDKKIAVIGSGPAGLLCAIRLIEHGFKPVIIERGESVEERKRTCERFFATGNLNTESNVQFGEGGAGAFSDGKLNTQTRDGFNRDVLEIFHRFGAPEEILYLNKPHAGSDKMYVVLQNMRRFIVENGGEYRFNTKFTGLTRRDGAISSLLLKDVKTGEESELRTDVAVLAIGHSARDTFEMLHLNGICMQPREFAIGVRIEHLSCRISEAQYGKKYKMLPAADYKLVSHAHERTVFTFCMCPGGVVIPAVSEEGGVAVNGMSLYARDGINSNSALMVQMKREDFGGEDLFAGMRFQREIERRAFSAAGGKYRAPVQLFGDFLAGRVSEKFGEVSPTYAAGTAFAPLDRVLPGVAVQALKAAIPDMGRKLRGFDCGDAVLTGAETRFSSPVKIIRGEDLCRVRLKGLYPCGEGSGYSGGITSSAADGLKIAEKIFEVCGNNH